MPPKGLRGDFVGDPAQCVDLVRVDGFEEFGPGGEVAVQRADADACAACDVLERGVGAMCGEGLAGSEQQRVVIASRVGAARAPGRDDLVHRGVRHGGLLT